MSKYSNRLRFPSNEKTTMFAGIAKIVTIVVIISSIFFSKYNRLHLFCVCFVLVKINMLINSAVREDLLSYPTNCVNFIGKKNSKVWHINMEIFQISIAT